MTSMHLGGAERSLIGLLEAFDYDKYDVSLFVYDQSGELMADIPNAVRLLPEIKEYKALEQPISYAICNGLWKVTFGRVVGKIRSRSYAKRFKGCTDIIVGTEYKQKYTYRYLPFISGDEYDVAISFMIPHYVVAAKVRAKIKIAWVHTDYTKMHLDLESEEAMWVQYDCIVGVSEGVAESFKTVFPSLKDKVIVIENILSEKTIKERAKEVISDFDHSHMNLLSVGRFTAAKNFDNVPEICKELVNQGLDVIWYLIGYGPDEEVIKNRIRECGMEGRVVILGKKENPYPYIAACDYYIQPSRYEGKAVTVREAQMLGKPVIITDYPTSSSQLTDGYDGIIVPMDNEGCARGIANVLQDKELTERLSANCLQEDYTNKNEINKLYSLIQ